MKKILFFIICFITVSFGNLYTASRVGDIAGVYTCGRDLQETGVANHQFILFIYQNLEQAKSMKEKYQIDYKLSQRNYLGLKFYYSTLGAYANNAGDLELRLLYSGDVKPVESNLNGGNYLSLEYKRIPFWAYEDKNNIPYTGYSMIETLSKRAYGYKVNQENGHVPSYKTIYRNCQTWIYTMLSFVNIPKDDRHYLTEFDGFDSYFADEREISKTYFYITALVEKWVSGDFDSDGRDEIIYKLKNSTKVYITNFLDGDLGQCVYDGVYHVDKFLAGDFDGDGDDEILTTFKGIPKVYFSENGTNLVATTSYKGNYYVQMWTSGDFNGDGKDEILTRFKNLPTVYYSQKPTYLLSAKSYTGSYYTNKFLVGDFDGDGDDDIQTTFKGLPKVYYNNNGRNLVATTSYSGAMEVENWVCGDFDGNGRDEILTKFNKSHNVYYTQTPNYLLSDRSYIGNYDVEMFLSGDFDGDGDEELLTKFKHLNKVYWSNSARNICAATSYTGNYRVSKWISADTDGYNGSDIYTLFNDINALYYSHSPSNICAKKILPQ